MSELVYFNWAADLCPEPPNPRLRDEIALFSAVQDQWAHQPDYAWDELWTAIGRARKNLAPFLGVNSQAGHLLFTTGTLHGLQILTSSYGTADQPGLVTPGMRVLTTDVEYGDVYRELVGRFDVSVVRVADAASADEIVDRVARAVDRFRPGLLVMSHVSLLDGLVLPVAEILARLRAEHGDRAPLSIIDGAQAAGNVRVDLEAMAPDAYIGCFHKWLQGPNLTGWLYLRDRDPLLHLARRALHVLSFDRELLASTGLPVATECSKIGLLVPETAALGQHLEYLFYHGLHGTRGAATARADRLRAALADDPALAPHLLSPPAGLRSNIVTLRLADPGRLRTAAGFEHARQRGDAILRALRCSRDRPGVAATSYVPRIPAGLADPVRQPGVLRFSCVDLWNRPADVDLAAARVAEAWSPRAAP